MTDEQDRLSLPPTGSATPGGPGRRRSVAARPRLVGILSVSLLLLTVASAGAGSVQPALERAVQRADGGERIPVIVVLTPREDAIEEASPPPGGAAHRARLVALLHARFASARREPEEALQRAGITGAVPLWAINAFAVAAPADLIAELARTRGVEEVRLDRVIRVPALASAPTAEEDWHLTRIRAPEAWALGFTGQGVVVASLDSGVDPAHRQLARHWRGGGNSWFDPSGEHASPADLSGHGTQVMGLMVGDGSGGSVAGVAPGAQWIAAKIFDDGGEGSFSDVHLAFQWLLDPDGDPDTDDAPQLVNGSWGLAELAGQCSDEFAADIALLRSAGIAVVFSAGNSGPADATSVSPANNPGAVAVGGSEADDTVASFSSRGPSACGGAFPRLVAPAVALRTTDLTFGGTFPDAFAYVSGTSFAAPQVTGAMAVLLSAFPGASPEQLEEAIAAGAVDIGPPGPDEDSGVGRLDVTTSLAALEGIMSGPGCTDADADGFYAEEGCGSARDCDDDDPSVHPGALDWPDGGIDQNCDGPDLRARPLPAPRLHW